MSALRTLDGTGDGTLDGVTDLLADVLLERLVFPVEFRSPLLEFSLAVLDALFALVEFGLAFGDAVLTVLEGCPLVGELFAALDEVLFALVEAPGSFLEVDRFHLLGLPVASRPVLGCGRPVRRRVVGRLFALDDSLGLFDTFGSGLFTLVGRVFRLVFVPCITLVTHYLYIC